MQSRKMYTEPHPARNPVYQKLKKAQDTLRVLVLKYKPEEDPEEKEWEKVTAAALDVLLLERIAPLLQIEV